MHQAVNALRVTNTQVSSCLPALLTALPGGSLASNYTAVFGLLVEQVGESVNALNGLLGTMQGKPGNDACRVLVHALLTNLKAKLGAAIPLFDRQMGQSQPSSQSQSNANPTTTFSSVEVPVRAEDLGDPFAEPSTPDSSAQTPIEVPITAEELGDPFAEPAASSEHVADDSQSQPDASISTEEAGEPSASSSDAMEDATQEDDEASIEEPAGGGEPVEQPLTQQVRELAEEMAGQPRVFDVTEDEAQVLLRAFQLLATYPNVNWERFKVKPTDANGNEQGVSFLEWILDNTDINPDDYPHIFLERVSPTGNGGTLSLSQQAELAQFVAQSILVGYDIHQLGRITPGDLQKLASA